MKTPLVSLGLPVYNGERTLPAALAAIAAQSMTDYELLIADNASTDDTERICRAAAARDPRIVYMRNDTNVGILNNFEIVASRARGDFFAWMACDDTWDSEYLAQLTSALLAHPDAGFSYSDYDWIDETGVTVAPGQTHLFVPGWVPGIVRDLFAVDAGNSQLHNFCLYYFWRNPFLLYGLYRREVVTRALPFQYVLETAHNADNLFMLRVLTFTKPILVEKVLFHYRRKPRDRDEAYSRTGTVSNTLSSQEKRLAFESLARDLALGGAFSPWKTRMLRAILPLLSLVRRLA
jgi:glycosyltransferase involved in cell wall biosynthesis